VADLWQVFPGSYPPHREHRLASVGSLEDNASSSCVSTQNWYVLSLEPQHKVEGEIDIFRRVGPSTRLPGFFAERPCALVGALNNDWTLGLAGELRLYFDNDEQNRLLIVRDRQRPDITEWNVVNTWPHRTINVDYASVYG